MAARSAAAGAGQFIIVHRHASIMAAPRRAGNPSRDRQGAVTTGTLRQTTPPLPSGRGSDGLARRPTQPRGAARRPETWRPGGRRLTPEEQATRALLDQWLSDSSLLEIVFLGVEDAATPQTSLRLVGFIKEIGEERVSLAAAREPFLTITLELGGGIDFATGKDQAPPGEANRRPYRSFVAFELPAGGSLFLGELAS